MTTTVLDTRKAKTDLQFINQIDSIFSDTENKNRALVLKLDIERQITLNGVTLQIPPGTPPLLTGKAVKALLNIYDGFAIYINNGGLFRVKDADMVVIDSQSLQSVDERPKPQIEAIPRYNND